MEEPEMEQNSFDIPHDFFKKVCDFTIPKTSEYAVRMVFYQKKPS
jgi:glutamate synthase (ferredoxin)